MQTSVRCRWRKNPVLRIIRSKLCNMVQELVGVVDAKLHGPRRQTNGVRESTAPVAHDVCRGLVFIIQTSDEICRPGTLESLKRDNICLSHCILDQTPRLTSLAHVNNVMSCNVMLYTIVFIKTFSRQTSLSSSYLFYNFLNQRILIKHFIYCTIDFKGYSILIGTNEIINKMTI